MSPRNIKILWVLVAMLISLVVALVAGILVSITGASPAEAVLYGGGVFGGALTICLLVMSSLGAL